MNRLLHPGRHRQVLTDSEFMSAFSGLTQGCHILLKSIGNFIFHTIVNAG